MGIGRKLLSAGKNRDHITEIAVNPCASAQSQALISQKCLRRSRILNPVGTKFGLFRLVKPAHLQVFLLGVDDRIRTGDRLDHNQELYQLSYVHRVAPI